MNAIWLCGDRECRSCYPDIELPESDPKTWEGPTVYPDHWDRVNKRFVSGPSPGPAPDYSLDYKSGWFDGFHAAQAAP